jgi:GDPmannose 4,6-dehydratase
MTTKAFVTGCTGQAGSYLIEQLLTKGYEVHGIIRPASTFTDTRLNNIYVDPHDKGAKLFLNYGDLMVGGQLTDLLYSIKPDFVYNLGAQSHVMRSFEMPEYTCDVVGLGTLRLLEAIRRSGIKTRMYQSSSSEMFGNEFAPQNEKTPFSPRSPYACAKVFAHNMCHNYREGYGLFISCGILFNMDSPRRLPTAVTKKITMAVANIVAKRQDKLFLGNINAKRDWGYAPEYTQAMQLMLEHDDPDDFVIGTGESHTVKEFLDEAFGYANLDWHDYVVIDKQYYRPTEVDNLRADFSKAQNILGWQPKVRFKELVGIMVESDLRETKCR